MVEREYRARGGLVLLAVLFFDGAKTVAPEEVAPAARRGERHYIPAPSRSYKLKRRVETYQRLYLALETPVELVAPVTADQGAFPACIVEDSVWECQINRHHSK